MTVTASPTNIAAAALAGAILAYVVQPPLPTAPAAAPLPRKLPSCATAQCLPASTPTADEETRPPRLIPMVEQIRSFDV